MIKKSHKTWLSPCIAISFAIVALTGFLMFFHLGNRYLKNLHEWLGLLFGLAGIIHLLLNWPVLVSYLKKRGALFSVMSVLLLSLICLLGGKNERHERGLHGDSSSYGMQRHGYGHRK